MLELSYKRILLMALPLMFGTFVQSTIAITDGAFVNSLGNIAYGAVGNGSLVYMALFMLCRGLSDGTQITIAKKYGEEKYTEVGQVLFNSQFLQLILTGVIFVVFFFFSEIIILKIAKSKEIGLAMSEFMQYRSWGIFFAGLMISMNAFYIGLGKTNIIIFSTLLLAFTNIILDYGLIFGKLGLPELGMIGAPIASSISEALTFLFLFIYALKAPSFGRFAYNMKVKLSRLFINPLLKLSYPLMLQGLVSLSTWLIFFSMIEHMGPENLQVAHNIRYMYFFAFIPIFGFVSATRTYVSYLVGRNEQVKIPIVQRRIILLSVASMVLLFHGALLYPEYLISIVEHSSEFSSEIMQQSADTLQFISGSILIFAIAMIPYHSVAALGKTRESFLMECLSIVVYLFFCYLFIEKWQWDIVNIWWVEYIYFGSLGILSISYLFYYRKRLGLVSYDNG